MSDLETLLNGRAPANVYRLLSRATPRSIAHTIESLGWRCFYLDGRRARDKKSFLDAIAVSLHFPAYFGHNWDALDECITDLAWAPAPGYVLLFDHVHWLACHHPQDWRTVMEIFRQAVAVWRAEAVPFSVLLRHTRGCAGPVPAL